MQHHRDSYNEPSSNTGAEWERMNQKLRKQKAKIDKLSRAFEKVSFQNQNSSTNSRDERGRSRAHISRASASSSSSSSSSPSPSPVRRHRSHTSRRSNTDEIRRVLAEELGKRDDRMDRMQSENAAILNEIRSMNNAVKPANDPVMAEMAATGKAILEMLKKHDDEINELKQDRIRRSDSEPTVIHNTYNMYYDYSQTYNDESFNLSLGFGGGGLGGLLPALGFGSRPTQPSLPAPNRPSLPPPPPK